MKVALASDERTSLTDFLVWDLERRNHKVLRFGSIADGDPEVDWPQSSRNAAEAVARGEADEATVCCWTGTRASIAANKVVGIRAALCADAETARGALPCAWPNRARYLPEVFPPATKRSAKRAYQVWDWTPTHTDRILSGNRGRRGLLSGFDWAR